MPNPISSLSSLQRFTNFSNTYGQYQLGPIGLWLQGINRYFRNRALRSVQKATRMDNALNNSRRAENRLQRTRLRNTLNPSNSNSNIRPGVITSKEVVVTTPKKTLVTPTRLKNTLLNRIDWDQQFLNELASWSPEDINKIDALGFYFNNARELQNSINTYLANNPSLGISPLALDDKWSNKSRNALRAILSSYNAPTVMPGTRTEITQLTPTYSRRYIPEDMSNYDWVNMGEDNYYKLGGKINKYQKGGTMNKQQEALIKSVVADFVKEKGKLPKDEKELTDYISSKGGEKYLQSKMQSLSKKAAHGAKLNYIHKLTHKCPDGFELYYFKRGGSVDCGCKKKENGGEVTKAQKGDTITKFKNRKKTHIAEEDTIHTKNGVKDLSGKTNYPKFDPKKATKEEKRRASDKDYMAGRSAKQGAKLNKNCGGSKMKLEKGNKVCPKCGKVHAAGMGCSIAKFKMHRQGGSLNGIPFINREQIKVV